jgi:hypothetical protein
MPVLGAISLLGAWLLVRVPRGQPLVAVTTLAVVAALFGLGGWAFQDMYQRPFGPKIAVVPGPGGTVELEPGPRAGIGGPGRAAPVGPGRAVGVGPLAGLVLARHHDRQPIDIADRGTTNTGPLIPASLTPGGIPIVLAPARNRAV